MGEDILESIDTEQIRQLRLIDCVETVNEEHVEGMKEERGDEHGEEDAHQEVDHGSHETLTPDEHVCTSPENAISIVERITEELAGLDQSIRQSMKKTKKHMENSWKNWMMHSVR